MDGVSLKFHNDEWMISFEQRENGFVPVVSDKGIECPIPLLMSDQEINRIAPKLKIIDDSKLVFSIFVLAVAGCISTHLKSNRDG
jgi:hypothetical protein